MTPRNAASLAWVRDLRAAMTPYTTGAYVNYIDADLPDWASAYYGTNLARLQQVKTDYDPDDVFNGPQSIPFTLPLRSESLVFMEIWALTMAILMCRSSGHQSIVPRQAAFSRGG